MDDSNVKNYPNINIYDEKIERLIAVLVKNFTKLLEVCVHIAGEKKFQDAIKVPKSIASDFYDHDHTIKGHLVSTMYKEFKGIDNHNCCKVSDVALKRCDVA